MSGSSDAPFDWSHGSGVNDAPATQPGARFGPFEIQGTLGRGGMGLVLAARDSLGRDVALKLLNRARPSERAVERFRREGQVMASLSHPGIVTVHEAGLVDGCPFLSCSRIDGQDLDALLEAGAPRDLLLSLVGEVADAVGYAHQRGIVHRDLKPSNVLVDTEGHAHVTDFGLAQAVGLDRMTLTGALVGTPTYMAPEQITSARDAFGPHTDTWALGVMLYRILTGTEPFQGDTLVDLSAAILRGEPTAPRSVDPTISKDLEAVCLKALRKRPEERYPDGLAFAADLVRGRSGERPLARRAQPPRRWAGVGLALLGAAGGVALIVNHRPEPQAAEGPPPSAPSPERAPESPAEARLRTELDAALETALRDPARAAQAVGPWAPRVRAHPALHPRVRATQTQLAARAMADLKAGRPSATSLGAIAVLCALLPPDGPPFPGSTALADAVVSACGPILSADPPRALDLLDRLHRCGVRSNDPVAATDLFENVLNRLGLARDPDSIATGRRLILTCAKLDVGTGGYAARKPEMFQAFGPQGDDPWAVYVRARSSKKTPERRITLLRFLRHPPNGFELGPVHWAETARHIAPGFSDEQRLRLLREAGRRDPRSYLVQSELCGALRQTHQWEEALVAAERSRELFLQHGFLARSGLISEWETVLAQRVKALVRAGRRARAREAYRELAQAFPLRDRGNATRALKRKHPWLLAD